MTYITFSWSKLKQLVLNLFGVLSVLNILTDVTQNLDTDFEVLETPNNNHNNAH